MGRALKTIGSQVDLALRETLKKARIAAKLSQEDLAKRLKRYQSYVSKIERGQKVASAAEVVAWAVACDMEPIVLFSMFCTRLSRRI